MIKLKRVLVPINFSEFSAKALRYGQELCEKFEAELHLLHSLEVHVTQTPKFTMGLALPDREEESAEQVMEKMNQLAGDWAGNRTVHMATAKGSPFVEVIKYAKEHDIDVIVIGTHGRTGLSHVFMGSVAENIVRQSPCPVLVVRKEGHQFVAP